MMMLFTINNAKTIKGEKHGWRTLVLYMLPHTSANLGRNICPRSTPQCRETCLVYAGRGVFSAVRRARWERTRQYVEDQPGFIARLAAEIHKEAVRAKADGFKLAVRINGTSDLPSLAGRVQKWSPPVRFYDYTKIPFAWDRNPDIHYTFSRSETNEAECLQALDFGRNVAVVFSTKRGQPLPAYSTLGGIRFRVHDGDAHDLRFLDPQGVIVGLRAKGRARKLTGGFVVQV